MLVPIETHSLSGIGWPSQAWLSEPEDLFQKWDRPERPHDSKIDRHRTCLGQESDQVISRDPIEQIEEGIRSQIGLVPQE